MTTIAYARNILATDSRQTHETWANGAMVSRSFLRICKIRPTPLFVVAGAGSSAVIRVLGFLPILLWMALTRCAVFPCLHGKMAAGTHSLHVIWRTGTLWAYTLHAYPVCGLVFVRASLRRHTNPRGDLLLISGSGGDHLTLDDLRANGAQGAVRLAATRCPHTDADVLAFDTRRWCFLGAARPPRSLWRDLHAAACALVGLTPEATASPPSDTEHGPTPGGSVTPVPGSS